jgi:hypothetical protein
LSVATLVSRTSFRNDSDRLRRRPRYSGKRLISTQKESSAHRKATFSPSHPAFGHLLPPGEKGHVALFGCGEAALGMAQSVFVGNKNAAGLG